MAVLLTKGWFELRFRLNWVAKVAARIAAFDINRLYYLEGRNIIA